MTERAQKICNGLSAEYKVVLAAVIREIVSDYETWEDGTYMVKSKDIFEIADELEAL